MSLKGQVITLSPNASDHTKYDVFNAGTLIATGLADGGALLANVLAALRSAGATAATYVQIESISSNSLYRGLVG